MYMKLEICDWNRHGVCVVLLSLLLNSKSYNSSVVRAADNNFKDSYLDLKFFFMVNGYDCFLFFLFGFAYQL